MGGCGGEPIVPLDEAKKDKEAFSDFFSDAFVFSPSPQMEITGDSLPRLAEMSMIDMRPMSVIDFDEESTTEELVRVRQICTIGYVHMYTS